VEELMCMRSWLRYRQFCVFSVLFITMNGSYFAEEIDRSIWFLGSRKTLGLHREPQISVVNCEVVALAELQAVRAT
jgi:hypothetical protein